MPIISLTCEREITAKCTKPCELVLTFYETAGKKKQKKKKKKLISPFANQSHESY